MNRKEEEKLIDICWEVLEDGTTNRLEFEKKVRERLNS